MDALAMLQELLEQDQFELVFREKQEKADKDIRLVYLMNDAVESFLVFKNARMTGEYRKDYEGELEASISHNGKEYILIVRQGNSVVTLFFDDIFPVYFKFFLGLYIILTICFLLSFISFENVVLRMRKFPKKSDGFLGEICIFAEQIQ